MGVGWAGIEKTEKAAITMIDVAQVAPSSRSVNLIAEPDDVPTGIRARIIVLSPVDGGGQRRPQPITDTIVARGRSTTPCNPAPSCMRDRPLGSAHPAFRPRRRRTVSLRRDRRGPRG